MGAKSRRKGAAGEREWCAELRNYGFPHAERALDQPRSGGGDVPLPPILWEVKRRAKNVVYDFMGQAENAVKFYPGCTVPAVALRADSKPWVIVMEADDFFKILAQYGALQRLQMEHLK